MTDFNVWVLGLDLPEVPHKAWDAIKRTFTQGVEMTAAKDAVFPAVRELWRFAVSTTLHDIWLERLRRINDPSLTEETHIARAKTQFRRAIIRFRGFVYQPDMNKDGDLFARVRSALADTLLCVEEPPATQVLPICRCPGMIFLLFFDGGS